MGVFNSPQNQDNKGDKGDTGAIGPKGDKGIGFTLTQDGHYDLGNNKKLINVDEGTDDNDCVTKKQLDLKLDRATFVISNSLPGVPVLDGISIALIPALSVLTSDTNDRVSRWVDPVNNISFTQTDNSKKPLLLRDSNKKRFFLRFDGTDDYLRINSFDVSKVAGPNGNTCTVIMVVNTKQVKKQSQFQWGQANIRFGVHFPWNNGTVWVDFGTLSSGRLTALSLSDLTGNIEVWTIRVNGQNMELFRGISSMTPVGTETISATLSGNPQKMFVGCQVDNDDGTAVNFSEMDLYAFSVWQKSLSNDELKNMFRFLEDYFDL